MMEYEMRVIYDVEILLFLHQMMIDLMRNAMMLLQVVIALLVSVLHDTHMMFRLKHVF